MPVNVSGADTGRGGGCGVAGEYGSLAAIGDGRALLACVGGATLLCSLARWGAGRCGAVAWSRPAPAGVIVERVFAAAAAPDGVLVLVATIVTTTATATAGAGGAAADGVARDGCVLALPSTAAASVLAAELGEPRGVAVDASRERLLVADAGQRTVWRWDLATSPVCRVAARTALVTLDASRGVPVGVAVDAGGRVWCPLAMSGEVVAFAGDSGEELAHIMCPHLNVTGIAFGGPTLDAAFVTASADAPEPGAAVPDPAIHAGAAPPPEWASPAEVVALALRRPVAALCTVKMAALTGARCATVSPTALVPSPAAAVGSAPPPAVEADSGGATAIHFSL